MRAAESLKTCTLIGSFCRKHVKIQMKKYRTVMFHDTEEWCKVWRKTDLWFQKRHEEFGEFSLKHSKAQKFHCDGLFLSNVYVVWVKKYRGVIFHDTEQWCKICIHPEHVVLKMAWYGSTLFFYKQSIFDPRPENCLSFSKKSPQKIV